MGLSLKHLITLLYRSMNLWTTISEIGLKPDDTPEYVRKAHLINRMSFSGALVSSLFAIYVYGIGDHKYLFFEIVASPLVFVFMVFSRLRLYNISLYWFYGAIFLKVFFSSIELQGAGVEYFFIPLGLMAFTMLENIIICAFLLILSILGFFASYWIKPQYANHFALGEALAHYTFVPVLAFTFILCTIMVLQFRIVSHKHEAVIKEKARLLYEKNKEITDSITYAKHLQKAILPPLSLLDEHLPEYFLFYKPKDIVAGDFYWLEEKNGIVYLAAADSTGHGIPGAIVSVVCYNALTRSLNEYGITEPGRILDKSRELVIETFARGESEVKDGMDISLCAIDFKTLTLLWSGANNALIYVSGGTMKELAADKQPVGNSDHPKNFTTHRLSMNKGDCIFLTTDGYSDQFGGPKGQKFKSKKMRTLFAENAHLPMKELREVISREFKTWKSNLDQVDDVTVIGLRL